MRNKKLLLSLGIIMFICIFMTPGFSYAANPPDPATTATGKTAVSKELPGDEEDKGSPLHLWRALIAPADKGGLELKAGDTVTTSQIRSIRNWSDSTVNDEINSLIDIGVLRRDSRGNFTVLVTATDGQITQIHEAVKPIVDKTGVHNEALGLDAYRTDIGYLGADKVDRIKAVIANTTGSQTTGKANLLASVPDEKVFTTTANAILNTPGETVAITNAIASGYTIAVATQDTSTEYINRVINTFSDPDTISSLVNTQIIFSVVQDGDVLAAIERLVARTAGERTLNNLQPNQIAAIRSGV